MFAFEKDQCSDLPSNSEQVNADVYDILSDILFNTE